jgi:uncharacterized glyoxalase superfamily protein PhnB
MAENVKPIPEEYHSVTPHLIIRDCLGAIDFYKRAFGAEERGTMLGPNGKVMHAEIKIGNSVLMLAEEWLEWGAKSPETLGGTPVTLHVYVDDVDAVFDKAVEEGATVKMPVADQFWGDRYGQVADPYGHLWSLATHVKDPTPEEMEAAGKAAMAEMAANQQ